MTYANYTNVTETISLSSSSTTPDFCTKNFLQIKRNISSPLLSSPFLICYNERILSVKSWMGIGLGFVQDPLLFFLHGNISCVRRMMKTKTQPRPVCMACSSNACIPKFNCLCAGRQGGSNISRCAVCVCVSFFWDHFVNHSQHLSTYSHIQLFSSSHFSDSQPSTNHFFLKFHEIHTRVELRRPQWMCMP